MFSPFFAMIKKWNVFIIINCWVLMSCINSMMVTLSLGRSI